MNLLYEERLSSKKTQALFAILAVILGLLTIWRTNIADFDGPATLTLVLALVFLFYVLNYRTLVIRIDKKALTLQFGIFSWTVPSIGITPTKTSLLRSLNATMKKLS